LINDAQVTQSMSDFATISQDKEKFVKIRPATSQMNVDLSNQK
jgi:hypothetical protein